MLGDNYGTWRGSLTLQTHVRWLWPGNLHSLIPKQLLLTPGIAVPNDPNQKHFGGTVATPILGLQNTIYIYRESEREREGEIIFMLFIYIYIYLCMLFVHHICLYVYISNQISNMIHVYRCYFYITSDLLICHMTYINIYILDIS